MNLFGRKYLVTVGRTEIDALDVQFSITKTSKKEPNTCSLTVYNLSAENRGLLAQQKDIYTEVQAGYEDGIGLIFRGNLRDVISTHDGADWITELNSGDGETAIQASRINKSFSPGTKLSTVIAELAGSMRAKIGNAARKALEGDFDGAANEFLNGVVLSGRASTEMDGIAKSAGLEWSIQDDELQLLTIGGSLEGVAVKLNVDTGLIGSPSIDADGILTATSLMNWTIVPGRQLQVDATSVPPGFYRAERCEYVGDTSGQDWYVNIEAKQQ